MAIEHKELSIPAVIESITLDSSTNITKLAEQSIAVYNDILIYMVANVWESSLQPYDINPNAILNRKITIHRGDFIPRNFSLTVGDKKPVIGIAFNKNCYHLFLGKTKITNSFTERDADNLFNENSEYFLNLENKIKHIQSIFVVEGAKPIIREEVGNSRSGRLNHALTQFSRAYLADFFIQNNIPGIFINQKENEQDVFSLRPEGHQKTGLKALIGWTNPGRKVDAFINSLQLIRYLQGEHFLFKREDLIIAVNYLNRKNPNLSPTTFISTQK
jgi:hypothetical protein